MCTPNQLVLVKAKRLLKVRKNHKQFGCAVDSPKKQTNKFVLFAVKVKKAKKTILFVCFFGESTARQSAFGFI